MKADTMPEQPNVDQLRELYQSDVVARAFLDHCARRQRNQTETTVDRALANLNQDGGTLARADLVRVMKALAEIGCGDFVTGRRGWPSRFVWGTEMIVVGRVAAGEDQQIEQIEKETDDAGVSQKFLTHFFYLRSDVPVEIELPTDLRPDEAERLARFITALPFDTEP